MNKETGIRRVINATLYSYQGLVACWKYEAAFRQELLLTVCLTPLAFYITDNVLLRLFLLGSCLLILIVELLNSAIEAVVDRIGADYHDLSGRAKDLGSAAVFISLINVASVWGYAIYQYFS